MPYGPSHGAADIRSWVRRGVPDVVTCDLAGGDRSDLVVETRELRHRTALLGAVIGLLIAMPLRAIEREQSLAAECSAPTRASLFFKVLQLVP